MTVRCGRFGLAASALVLVAGCTGSPGPDPTPSAGTPAPTGLTASGTTPAPSASNQALIDAVREDGSVRVILSLTVPYSPEADLPDADAVRRQRAGIADAQRRVLDELARYRADVNARYERWPQLALTVDEAALRHVLASPLVAAIQHDRPQSTND